MTAPAREGSDLQLGTAGVPGLAWTQRYEQALMNTFGPPQRVLVRGEGCYVWDADGNRYLDLLAGIAVNALGHAHPMLVSAVTAQLATLGHVSNFFATAPQVALAERLLQLLGAPDGSRVFFCNSGAEAVEAAVKLSRRTGRRGQVAAEGEPAEVLRDEVLAEVYGDEHVRARQAFGRTFVWSEL